MKRATTEIYSIFSQIDMVVAEAMVSEGKATKIERDLIPPTVRFDDTGSAAHFAIVLPDRYLPEYERRVAALRF